MSIIKQIQDNVLALLESDLADDFTDAEAEFDITLGRPTIHTGFVDPFATVAPFPKVYVYSVGRGVPDDSLKVMPIRFGIMLVNTTAIHEVQDAVNVGADIVADLIVGGGPSLDGVLDVEGIEVDLYYGPPDVKQKSVAVVNFNLLVYYQRS